MSRAGCVGKRADTSLMYARVVPFELGRLDQTHDGRGALAYHQRAGVNQFFLPVAPGCRPEFPIVLSWTTRLRPAAGVRTPRDAGEDAMFRFDPDLKVSLHRDAIDFRVGHNGLAILVEQAFGMGPFAQADYVFRDKRRDRIKILGWQRNGLSLLMKRLKHDRFVWPDVATVPSQTVEQLH